MARGCPKDRPAPPPGPSRNTCAAPPTECCVAEPWPRRARRPPGARHRRQALACLDGVLVEPARGGGLTAFVPAATARAAVVQLYAALNAVRDAVDYQRGTGGMEAFDAAVNAGVSRELTESLVALVRGSEGARVALAWAPGAGVPEGCAARPEPVDFSPGDLPALRAAGAATSVVNRGVLVRVTGAVVRLRRPEPRGPGLVRLRVLAGAEVAHVRVELDEEAYRIAGHAHLVGLPIRVVGRLESRDGSGGSAAPMTWRRSRWTTPSGTG